MRYAMSADAAQAPAVSEEAQAMDLSASQLVEYRENGFLMLRNLLRPPELETLRAALPALTERNVLQIRRDAPDGPPKIIYAPHADSAVYAAAARLPRVLGPVEQILNEAAWLYQARINLKLPFAGDAWSWHQDFTAWHRNDGMPRPHAVMTAIFLHDCTVANGPLLVVPRSHREDLADILHREADVEGYAMERITVETLARLAERGGGIADLLGPAGSVAFIHPTLLHASAANLTPWARSILYFNYSAASNRTRQSHRPWFMNDTGAEPLVPGRDDALTPSRHAA